MIKLCVSQRIIPDYRVAVFRKLALQPDIELTVFYGRGLQQGSERNADRIEGFRSLCLSTMPIHINFRNTEHYRVFHPTLWYHIIREGFDVIIVEPVTNIFNNLLIFPLCKMLGIKIIWWEAFHEGMTSFPRKHADYLVRNMILASDAYITYHSLSDKYLKDLGVPEKKIFRAQNTIDTDQVESDIRRFEGQSEDLRRLLGLKQSRIALYIGALERRKKIDNFIEAVGIARERELDVKAVIVGDGSYAKELEETLSSDQREYILMVGRHSHDAVKYILASDIVVLPGQGGLTVNHALACGRAVIATEEADAIYDYIEDGVNGFVVETDSPDEIAQAMFIALRDPEKIRSLNEGALNSRKQFSLSRMVDGIIDAVEYAVYGI